MLDESEFTAISIDCTTDQIASKDSKDENEQFKENNFMKLQETFTKQKTQADENKSGGKASGKIAKGGTASGGYDIYKIVKVPIQRFL
ncbi:hypothetical protein Cni_G22440 [Canna indica]|uniref:Uncharacterized protein n=1 Tax=Canna indica TaxID=4628 RepID=A0AAQ3KXY5_9LILI|nr:hypothetical protein Cni_G22440 [Canna indica]